MSNHAELLTQLRDLAAKFRAASPEGRQGIVKTYNSALATLLDEGWDDYLDPDEELPHEHMDVRYLNRGVEAVRPPRHLFATLCERYDPVLMTINQASGQNIVGTIERAYARKFSGPTGYPHNISFVGSTSAWGNVTLKQGERALVFLCSYSGRFYQFHWHGHFSVQNIKGAPHAIANWDLLGGAKWEPAELYEAAFLPDPCFPHRVAIPFELLEKHLGVCT